MSKQSTAALPYVAALVLLGALTITAGTLVAFAVVFFVVIIGVVSVGRMAPYLRFFSRAFFQGD